MAGRSRSSSMQPVHEQRFGQRIDNHIPRAPTNVYGSVASNGQENRSASRGRSQSRRRTSKLRLNSNLIPTILNNKQARAQNQLSNSFAQNLQVPSQHTESTRSEIGPKNGSTIANAASKAHPANFFDLSQHPLHSTI